LWEEISLDIKTEQKAGWLYPFDVWLQIEYSIENICWTIKHFIDEVETDKQDGQSTIDIYWFQLDTQVENIGI
jgi:hypothetical protein